VTPLQRALLAASLVVNFGLGLSFVALHFGLIGRVAWPAAVIVPVVVAAIVYVHASRREPPVRR
jgi:hypothetical protein